MKKLLLSTALFISLTGSANSAWHWDGYGYVSNICRAGPYWQIVPWNYVGTSCYMPGWNLYGKRVAE